MAIYGSRGVYEQTHTLSHVEIRLNKATEVFNFSYNIFTLYSGKKNKMSSDGHFTIKKHASSMSLSFYYQNNLNPNSAHHSFGVW